MVKVEFPDGSKKEFSDGINGFDVAMSISEGLARNALAIELNGKLVDLTTTITTDSSVRIITFKDPEGVEIFRHSSAHLLAHAIKRLYPEAKPTIGPAVENGFYYDFENLNISSDDFPKIEEEMKKIVGEALVPKRIEYDSKEEALKLFSNNKFKVEMIENLEEGLSVYEQGDFSDLCRGPHIPNTKMIKSFKLLKLAGAYWRGDATKPQLTRVYGTSFPDKKDLKDYLFMLEEAKKRDHRKIGRELDLFSFHDEGPGFPFFHPKGMLMWHELMKLWHEVHIRAGYQEIKTPVMLTKELWETSGHWENYRENMYISNIDDHEFAIKPMNCPGGMLYYKEKLHSYREFPLRVGEIGLVHRHELSGALSGLFRVRCFHQDDAHIFMTEEQISDEILEVLKLVDEMYSIFNLPFHLELSTRPDKSIGSDEAWNLAERSLRQALELSGRDYVVNEGDGAFYGPKIDVHIKDAIGRTHQCATIQLDMNLPERFDLTYEGQDGKKHRPVMVHRVIYGSIERFFGILVEHYAGKFPLWLNPNQVTIIPITDNHLDYAEKIGKEFITAGLRVNVDGRSESVNKKVREAQLQQYNYILVVGDKEKESNTVNVRTRDNIVHGEISVTEFVAKLCDEVVKRI